MRGKEHEPALPEGLDRLPPKISRTPAAAFQRLSCGCCLFVRLHRHSSLSPITEGNRCGLLQARSKVSSGPRRQAFRGPDNGVADSEICRHGTMQLNRRKQRKRRSGLRLSFGRGSWPNY